MARFKSIKTGDVVKIRPEWADRYPQLKRKAQVREEQGQFWVYSSFGGGRVGPFETRREAEEEAAKTSRREVERFDAANKNFVVREDVNGVPMDFWNGRELDRRAARHYNTRAEAEAGLSQARTRYPGKEFVVVGGPPHDDSWKALSDDVDPGKACEILDDGEVDGQPLTEAQRSMFGAACSRAKGFDAGVLGRSMALRGCAKSDNPFKEDKGSGSWLTWIGSLAALLGFSTGNAVINAMATGLVGTGVTIDAVESWFERGMTPREAASKIKGGYKSKAVSRPGDWVTVLLGGRELEGTLIEIGGGTAVVNIDGRTQRVSERDIVMDVDVDKGADWDDGWDIGSQELAQEQAIKRMSGVTT